MWLPSRQPYLLISLPILNITCDGAGEVCSTNSPPIWMNHIFKPENSGLNPASSCRPLMSYSVSAGLRGPLKQHDHMNSWHHIRIRDGCQNERSAVWTLSLLQQRYSWTQFNNFCFGTNFSTKFSHQLTLLYSKHFLKPKPVRQADGSHHSRSLIEESWSSFSSLSLSPIINYYLNKSLL